MADNVIASAVTGVGPTFATDDIGGVHYPLNKLGFGALDSFQIVDATHGLPVAVISSVPGTTATALGKAEDAAHASGDTGVFVLAVRADTIAALAGTNGDYAPIQVNAEGAVRATLIGDTVGGLTPSKTISAASTNATNVKNAAGTLYGIQVFNTNAAARYLKLYNKASAPTVGTDTPVKTITIPGATAGGGVVCNFGALGIAFGTGISFALTTGAADADTGAVAASEIVVNLDYK